ncbi:unnamed protein product [Pipistrellus nathusii]|uniref:Uncharacterized protein n=1 Tax=Pipistrellus nathusii TaxID=59473 RepID=A0ABN9ZF52_PIPNA
MLLFSQCKSVFTSLPRIGFVEGFVIEAVLLRDFHSFLPSFLPFSPPSFLFSFLVLLFSSSPSPSSSSPSPFSSSSSSSSSSSFFSSFSSSSSSFFSSFL